MRKVYLGNTFDDDLLSYFIAETIKAWKDCVSS